MSGKADACAGDAPLPLPRHAPQHPHLPPPCHRTLPGAGKSRRARRRRRTKTRAPTTRCLTQRTRRRRAMPEHVRAESRQAAAPADAQGDGRRHWRRRRLLRHPRVAWIRFPRKWHGPSAACCPPRCRCHYCRLHDGTLRPMPADCIVARCDCPTACLPAVLTSCKCPPAVLRTVLAFHVAVGIMRQPH
mgnify:CR=1 FL=1